MARRVEVRLPLTGSIDITLGISLRASRRRERTSDRPARWGATLLTAFSCVTAAFVPLAVAAAGADLGRLGAVMWPDSPSEAVAAASGAAPRPVLEARSGVVTTLRAEAPPIRAHVVAPGETLFTIAARYGITPQTLAFNNGLADTALVSPGRSLVVPPLDAAVHVVREGEELAAIAARYGIGEDEVRRVNGIAFDPADVSPGRALLLPIPDGRYPGFRLKVSDPPRVLAPRVRWPAQGVITQLFYGGHTGVDIAAPYGSPIVATDAGTVTAVGWRGSGGLSICVHHDWGLETCAYHAASATVEVGERVAAGQTIGTVGSSGVSSGPHVHWEARTNGVLVDPMTYAPPVQATVVGGATGRP
ncbi:MAG TPA: M23 family metallopeptidase [Candidatus Limnocylindria bacterium]|nr:M23 family metallopeptidase [Candidatus Limnocylindria bacterium]